MPGTATRPTMRRRLASGSAAVALAVATLGVDIGPAAAANCKPYTFIGIPGSNQGAQHTKDNVWGGQVYEVLFWFHTKLYGAGTAPSPASQSSSKARLLAVSYPAKLDTSYGDSEAAGLKEAKRLVNLVYAECGSSTKFVIAGYSQGAHVATNLVKQWPVPLDRLYKVGLMGNPKYDDDSSGSVPVKIEESANSARSVVGRGLLGEADWPSDRVGKIRDVCLQYDPVCDGSITGAVQAGVDSNSGAALMHTDGYQQVLSVVYSTSTKQWITTHYPGYTNDHIGRVLGWWFAS